MIKNTLIVLVGPTAVGKTELSLNIAEHFACDIISADSRQFYSSMKIGTAAPSKQDLSRAKHHFVSFLNPDDYYNASSYESDVIDMLDQIYETNNLALLTGGSMMYVSAITSGIDEMPDVDEEIRKNLYARHKNGEFDALRLQLKQLDPKYYAEADLKNHVRVIHALEICLTTGKPFSSFRKNEPKKRDFNILKIGLERPREELYERINHRVNLMIEAGLVDEVKRLVQYENENALNTVGYKEVFPYLKGEYTLDRAIELIQRNSRRYAKKQMTWFKRDADMTWFNPENTSEIIAFIAEKLAEA